MAAARAADGRGPQTTLEATVPAHFGFAQPFDLARALHLQEVPDERLRELAPVVFAAAEDGDSVAAGLARRVADEVVRLATVTLRRLEMTDQQPDVVLGGGLMRAAPAGAIEQIERGVREVAPAANIVVLRTGPIVGAALLGLDQLGAGADAGARLRAELHDAFLRVEHRSVPQADGRHVAASEGDRRGSAQATAP
jgi:N-acetylglucosamine kinase-like BadF-type ATPase